jgi:hypothetical protein
MTTTLETWFCKEVVSLSRFLWAKYFSLNDICRQLMEMYSDGVMSARKWCREFENCRKNIRDGDGGLTGRNST